MFLTVSKHSLNKIVGNQKLKKTLKRHPDIAVGPFDWSEKNFSQLFDGYYSALCFFANKYLNDLDLSRSLVQDVFVDLWIRREKISINSSIKSYLYHAVRNRSVDYLRIAKRSVKLTDVGEQHFQSPFVDAIEAAELNDRINKAINELPEKCREIFVLGRFEGLKYKQIAEQLNISVKTVEMQMGIALKKLRMKLADVQFVSFLLSVFMKKK